MWPAAATCTASWAMSYTRTRLPAAIAAELRRVRREAQRVERLRAHDEPPRAGLELLQHDRLHVRPAGRDGDERDPLPVGRDRRRPADAEPARILAVVLRHVHDRAGAAGLLDVDELGLRRRRPEGRGDHGEEVAVVRMRIRTRSTAKGSALLCPDRARRRGASVARDARPSEEESTRGRVQTDVGTLKNFVGGEWVEPSGRHRHRLQPGDRRGARPGAASPPPRTSTARSRPRPTRSRAGRTRPPASARSR